MRATLCKIALALFTLASVSDAQTKTIYLTFDDGPQPGTNDVLDVLKEEGAHGIFFLTGSNAISMGGIEGQKKVVLRELAEGHEIGNHCYVHLPMTKDQYRAAYGDLSTETQRADFHLNYNRNQSEFARRLAMPDLKFQFARLPGDGSTFPHLVAETEKLGMKHFHWANEFATNGTFKWLKNLDWNGVAGVAGDYGFLPRDGDVILFHDRHWAGEKRENLRALIRFFKDKGYTFGKLADWKPAPPKAPKPAAPATPAAPAAPAAPAKPAGA